MEEIEIKFLDVNPVEIEKKLQSLGAEKISDDIYEEWLFKRPEWINVRGRVRIRKAGKEVTIAYKETTKKTSEGNPEIEFIVSSLEAAHSFIEKMDIPLVRHQQKRRIHYTYNGVSVDIDFWPLIPPLIEIEGKTLLEVKRMARQLDLDEETAVDALQIHQEIYGINLSDIKEMVFTKTQLKHL